MQSANKAEMLENTGAAAADARREFAGGVVASRTGSATWLFEDWPQPALGTSDFSFSWEGATVDTATNTKTLLNAANGTAGFGIRLDRDSGSGYDAGSVNFYIGATSFVIDYGSDIFESLAQWTLACDRSANAVLYRNGVSVGLVDISAEVATSLDTTLYDIGIRQNTGYKLQSITPFNTALTTAQALSLYELGAQGFLAENKALAWGGVVSGKSVSFSNSTDGGTASVNKFDFVTTAANGLQNVVVTPSNKTFRVGSTFRVSLTNVVLPVSGEARMRINLVGVDVSNIVVVTGDGDYELVTTADSGNGGWGVRLSVTESGVSFAADVEIEQLGALAHLPLTDDCRQLKDIGPNRYDATASATGVTHMKQAERHSFRDDNATGTGSPYLVAAADILAANEVVTGVIVDGDYYSATGTQTDAYRRIQLVINGSHILVRRSNGTLVDTIATTSPASTTAFSITVLTSRY